LSATLAPRFDEIARSIQDSVPTRNGDWNELLGNLPSNLLAGGAGALVGGSAGALTSSATDRFNRQLNIDKNNPHRDERTLAKQMAESSDGKYTQAQVEDQLRIMGVTIDGKHQSGAPATLVGEEPNDMGAKWIGAGSTSDGKPIRMQWTAQVDPELQSHILAKYNSVGKDQVPSVFAYDRPKRNDWGFTLTGPFTEVNKTDIAFMRTTTADSMSMVSKNAGRLGSITAAAASVASPYAPGLAAVSYGATVVGLTADAIAQVARPDMGEYAYGGALSLGGKVASDRVPLAAPIINEAVESTKAMPFSERIRSWINERWGAIAMPKGSNE
jgi:filamentous hemagglutinin